MAITVTAEPTNTPPRVLLQLAEVEGTSATILRNDPDGASRPVRTAEPATLTGGGWTGYDYEAPFGAAVTYSVVGDIPQDVELLTPNQRTFESASDLGWIGFGNTTVAHTTAAARSGTGSLSVTAVAAGAINVITNTSPTQSPPVMSATAGVTYAGSVWTRAATTARSTTLRMGFFDNTGAQIGSYTVGAAVTNTTTGWTQITVSAVAPTNTARIAVYSAITSAAAGEAHYLDDATVTHVGAASEDSNTTTLDVTDVWLIHPGAPDLSVRVPAETVERLEDRSRGARAAVHQPLGRATPIVVNDIRPSASTGLTVLTDTLAQRDTLWALLTRGTAVLLNIPPALGWGVTYEWAAIGDVTETYFNRGLSPARVFSLPYQVVDRPVGGLLAQWTYADVLTHDTYAEVLTSYGTYSDLIANTAT